MKDTKRKGERNGRLEAGNKDKKRRRMQGLELGHKKGRQDWNK